MSINCFCHIHFQYFIVMPERIKTDNMLVDVVPTATLFDKFHINQRVTTDYRFRQSSDTAKSGGSETWVFKGSNTLH